MWECIYFSGALTGKFKRGQPLLEGTRLANAAKSGIDKLDLGGSPDMEKLMKDDKFWNLLDVMEKVAKNRGKLLFSNFT